MKYVIDGFTRKLIVDTIENEPIKKLIHELNFKFGLKVLDIVQKNENYARRPKEVVLTDPTGAFVVGRAWTETKGNELTYYFRSPYYKKDRGHGEEREIFFSKKLSTLIATIKRNRIIPDEARILDFYKYCFFNAMGKIEDSYGSYHKHDSLNAEESHEVLKYVFGEIEHQDLSILDKCKKLLDKYNNIDKIKESAKADVRRFFSDEGFYAIGVDSFDHFIIGKLKLNMVEGAYDMKNIEVVKPFERVKDLSNHDYLQPILLMQKVYHEQQGKYTKFYGNYIPPHDGLLKDLDIIQVTNLQINYDQFIWTFVSCSTL
jgi:hypothetical protein